ncbi:MAG: hypothetical protein KAH23_00170 [Kiritimatiellae bacterium]|nr:hypothetical protein [Kiritimatiellia bacterium]
MRRFMHKSISTFLILFVGIVSLGLIGPVVLQAQAAETSSGYLETVNSIQNSVGNVQTGLDTIADVGEKVLDDAGLSKTVLKYLDKSDAEKYVKRAGKYAKVLDAALKIIKAGKLSADAISALRNNDRAGFIKALNAAVREVATGVGSGGGAWGGAAIGTAICPGIGTIIGGIAGGLAGDKLAEIAYDKFGKPIIDDIAGDIYDRIKGTKAGTGLPNPGDGGEIKDEDDRPLVLQPFGT